MRNTNKHMKRLLAAALASLALAGALAGCGGQAGVDPDPGSSQMTDAERERQEAIDRANEQAMQDAQAEQDSKTGNTKPYTQDRVDSPNKGDGGGMSGLDDDPAVTQEPSGDGNDGQDDIGNNPAGGMYGDDGTQVVPEGMPELTMAALDVPEWSGQPWAVLNNGTPYFTAPEEFPRVSETYSSLDRQRRPGCALVVLKKKYEAKPDYSFEIKAGTLSVPGWNEDAYPGVIRDLDPDLIASGSPASGKLLYMRRLAGSGIGNVELGRRNTIVCTEYMGEYGLKTLEQMVKTYLDGHKAGSRRVIYRITPVFEGDEVLARGAVVEAMSLGDSDNEIMAGRDLCFNMFVYNVQPGVTIDYATGETSFDEDYDTSLSTTLCGVYVLDTARKEAHMPWCGKLAKDVNPVVQSYYYGTLASVSAWSLDWNACDCMNGGIEITDEPQDGDGADDSDDGGLSGWEAQMGVQP